MPSARRRLPRKTAEAFGIAQPDVSGYYFKPLKEAGVIEEQEGTGWRLSREYLPLRWITKIPLAASDETSRL